MVEDGYDVYGVIDASGAESPMAWEAAVAGLGGCGGHSRHARGEGENLSLPASVEPDWAVAVARVPLRARDDLIEQYLVFSILRPV